MRRFYILSYSTLLLCVLSMAIACASQDQDIKSITKSQLEDMLNKDNVVLLDVRTPQEIADGMIPGALHLDFRGDDFDAQLQKLSQDRPIVAYCASGGRSGKTLERLKAMGHKKLYNFGGYSNWTKE